MTLNNNISNIFSEFFHREKRGRNIWIATFLFLFCITRALLYLVVKAKISLKFQLND